MWTDEKNKADSYKQGNDNNEKTNMETCNF